MNGIREDIKGVMALRQGNRDHREALTSLAERVVAFVVSTKSDFVPKMEKKKQIITYSASNLVTCLNLIRTINLSRMIPRITVPCVQMAEGTRNLESGNHFLELKWKDHHHTFCIQFRNPTEMIPRIYYQLFYA